MFLLLSTWSVYAVAAPAPHDLAVEYQPVDWAGSPPFVDSSPRFSWRIASDDDKSRAIVQVAYQIVVTRGAAEIWDSGRVTSNETLFMPYGGGTSAAPALTSNTLYAWKVRTWTKSAGGSTESESPYVNSSFATALMDSAKDWSTPWIHSIKGNKQFRAEFTLQNEKPVRATAYFVGLGYGRLYVNGQRVQSRGGGDELGAWTTWARRVLYRAYEVPLALLNTTTGGTNCVGVRLGNGQYNSHWHKGALGFRMQLHVEYPGGDGRSAGAPVPLSWKDTPAPNTKDDVYEGETWDNRLDVNGWNEPGFNEDSWATSAPIPQSAQFEPHTASMTLHSYTPIRAVRKRKPIRMSEPSDNVFIFDFGTNEVGWPALQIRGHVSGTAITLAMSEQMQLHNKKCLVDCGADFPNATVYYPFGGAVDQFILRGDKSETAEAHWVYHGFQFVQVSGWPVNTSGKPTLDSISAVVVHSDNKRIADVVFPTDSSGIAGGVLNGMQANLIRSLLGNMHSVESDCPTRERVGWTGDAQATALSAVRNLDMAGFYAKWVQDMNDAQHDDGALSSTVPYAKHVPPVDPSWPTAYPQLMGLLHEFYGDVRIVQEHYDGVKRYVDYVGNVKRCPSCKAPTGFKTQTDGGLPWFYMNGDWMEYRAQKEELDTSGPLLSSFHYIKDLHLISKFAGLLGKDSDAKEYSARAVNMTSLFNERYLGPYKPPPPSPPPTPKPTPGPPSAPVTCDKQRESRKGGKEIVLYCGKGTGTKISKVLFADFGTPSGECQTPTSSDFVVNKTCSANASETVKKVASLCVGKEICRFRVSTTEFDTEGGDPCVGSIKSLAVQVQCSASAVVSSVALSANVSYNWNGEGQAVNAAPLAVGMTPPEHAQDVFSALVQDIERNNKHLTTGFIGNKYVLPCLTANGKGTLALDLAMSDTLPSWGYQIKEGATTIWENWSGAPDETNGNAPPSHNHHFMGGYGQWFHDSLVGLQQGPGIAFSHMIIKPEITTDPRLPFANATYSLPRGEVSVDWKQHSLQLESDGGLSLCSCCFSIRVSVHPNAEATVVVPTTYTELCLGQNSSWDGQFVVREGGAIVWESDGHVSASLGDGIHAVQFIKNQHQVAVRIGSGSYDFQLAPTV